MKHTNAPSRARRSTATERARFLAAFDRSGLSAADFARKHHLNYTTFCGWTRERRLRTVKAGTSAPLSRGWRQRRIRASAGPAFVEVEVAPPPAPVELLVELGASARLRVHCAGQLELAARLIQTFNASAAC